MMNENMKILALIPAHNESTRIGAVIDAVRQFLPVLVVDDGSSDDTSGVARQHGASVVRQEPNQGKGAALLNGFGHFLAGDYDAVITLDADGQHDPAEIPLFIDINQQDHCDLIIGQRNFRQMPFPRNYSNTIGTWMLSNAMGQYIPDNQSGYRLHSRRLVESVINSQEHGFEFEVEIIFMCVVRGFELAWVPIRTIYAGQASHIKPLRHIKHFFRITRCARELMRTKKQAR